MARAVRLDDLGKTIAGRYVVEESLGGGGMAAVYRVLDLHDDRRVALKRGLASGRQDSVKQKELLEREFHTLAQLAHPRIIEVYDYGVDEGGPYYTMELLDGADLHNAHPLPWQQACALLCDVASSLALLHSRGFIHRDVSARNVRRTADGRAKLIDFGAMTRLGVAKDVVGTPPFLAPEVLQMQSLDGRVDLFSLGALGYYLLTGQHAFPARRFRDLRDAWRSRPAPPNRTSPELPAALNGLILQLLSLDRGARPHTAAEVMQRLATIAGMSLEEHTGVSRAYLTSPVLVGRDSALIAARRRMLSLARGDGGTIVIHGTPGSGRSRMLDACALEAKLVGAAVLRADAGDQPGEWGVGRVLCAQLVQLMPEQASEAARLSRDVLSQVVDSLRSDGGTISLSASSSAAERSLLIREMRDFILVLSESQRLVIVVDDADRIDEPSAALLAALAHKTARHPLILALALDADSPFSGSPAMRLLASVADPIALVPLTAEQTESLLGSVFGRVPNLLPVATRIHAVCQGNPRAVMDMAQHLLDRNLARYEGGAWSLPAQLGARDLPESLSAALSARLASLSDDARELCDAMCVADGDGDALTLTHYVEITVHRDQRRLLSAVDELMLSRVLTGDSERVRFTQHGFVTVIEKQLSPVRTRWLHGQLADLLASIGGDVVRRVHHLLHAGRDRPAVELLRTLDLRERAVPILLLSASVASAQKHAMPARAVHELRRALVLRAAFDLDLEHFREHAPIVLAELERDAGLVRYRELSHLPETERLARSLADAQASYDALPEDARVHPVADAVRLLAAFCSTQRGVALSVFDKTLFDAVPSLAPLAPVSPAVVLGELTARAHRSTLTGRFQLAREDYQRILDRLGEPDAAGLASDERARVRYGAHTVLGQIDAGRGVATAELHAQALESSRAHRVSAWRVRALWHLMNGDAEESARCRRRSELTLLQEGGVAPYGGPAVLGELVSQVLIGDLIAIKQAVESVATLAARFPGWRPYFEFGQASAQLLQGDCRGALDRVSPVLGPMIAGDHAAYPYLCSVRILALSELGLHEQAAQLARHDCEQCERLQLTPAAGILHVSAALALAKSGAQREAEGLLERMIEYARSQEQQGVSLGTIYEARARLAAWSGDQLEFQRFADLCASEYRHGRNPVLATRLARLLEDARSAELSSPESLLPAARSSEQPADSEYATIHSRMLECVDEGDRARCVLTLLLQAIDSFAGYLYGIDETGHTLLSALPEDELDRDLQRWFGQLLAQELDEHDDRTASQRKHVPLRFTDARGRPFETIFLARPEGAQHRLAAVLVFHIGRGTRSRPARELQIELAEQLLTHGDVSGRLLEAAGTQTQTR